MNNIYFEALKVMPLSDIDHASFSSDLYLRVTPESRRLVSQYDFKNQVTTFKDNIEHDLWYEIPFAFPFKIFEKVNGVVKPWEFSHYNENGEHVYFNGICIGKYKEEIVVTDFSKYEF